ncbi:protein Wnt-4 isoform X1 [Drosophila albomicans]|uniref:Protein Wnt n=1 Tax=Drosophila albomicans TaxID=7291 RepID=A0A9C6T3J5_DROAB|nr:protein Wnt-4 isoform X1 [Drosophila albomicans]
MQTIFVNALLLLQLLCRLGRCQEQQLLLPSIESDPSVQQQQHSSNINNNNQQQQQQQHQHPHQQQQLHNSNPSLNSTLLNTLLTSTGQLGAGVGVGPGAAGGGVAGGGGVGGGAMINQLGGLAGLGSSTASAPAAGNGMGHGLGIGMGMGHGMGHGMVGHGMPHGVGHNVGHGMGMQGGQGQGGGHSHGHALAGLANLGIIVNSKGLQGMQGMSSGMPGGVGVGGYGSTMLQTGVAGGVATAGAGGGGGGGLDSPYEHYISEHTVMAVFTSQGQVGGPCRYMPATRRQNHQCRKETGLPGTLNEARKLATQHCEDQFRYDRWNCSIETRGKRNIFKKLYKETAFVHALTAAAMTHSIARACAEGRMTKCSCGPRKQNRADQDFQWGGCNDNLKHGKRVTRSFLELRGGDGDEVTEILRHDSEVGIEAVSTLMKDKCKCHGVSGSCSMKTCWKKMADFNATATLLRQKYNQAIRKAPNQRTMRQAPASRMKKPKQRRKQQQQQSKYTTLYYLETSPPFCAVTKDRQCLHPDNCANLCCGRGYVTRVFKQVEKCRCRFNNGRCCQLVCDFCQHYEDKYFCK